MVDQENRRDNYKKTMVAKPIVARTAISKEEEKKGA